MLQPSPDGGELLLRLLVPVAVHASSQGAIQGQAMQIPSPDGGELLRLRACRVPHLPRLISYERGRMRRGGLELRVRVRLHGRIPLLQLLRLLLLLLLLPLLLQLLRLLLQLMWLLLLLLLLLQLLRLLLLLQLLPLLLLLLQLPLLGSGEARW
jgi:hypothetical protein